MKELKQYICQQAEISISLHLCNSFKLLHFDCVVFTWTIAIISYNALLHFNVSTVKESIFGNDLHAAQMREIRLSSHHSSAFTIVSFLETLPFPLIIKRLLIGFLTYSI